MADPRMVTDATVRDFLTALESTDVAQSAVSVSAVAGALGTSLLLMVAALPTTRSDSVEERAALMQVSAALHDLRVQLFEAIDTETAVKLFAARNMPRISEIQREKREAAIQIALRAGADVPLEIIRLCVMGLKHASTVAASSCQAAASEVRLAVALLRIGMTAAQTNVEGRLTSLTDAGYSKTVIEEMSRLTEEGMTAARTAELMTQARPA